MRRAFRDIAQKGQVDLEATETAIRAASHSIGGRLLEKLLNADGVRFYDTPDFPAEFKPYAICQIQALDAYRALDDDVTWTYLSPPPVHFAPGERELDIAGTSFSPGVRRMMGQVGGKEAFADGRQDLERLAGLQVSTKAVERVSEALGEQIEQQNQREQKQILSGRVIPFSGEAAIANLYVAIDGTGIPVVARETEGRKGKDATGKAKTREAKLGCVFTQTTVDEEGYPIRDEASTTYVGAIETAEDFGRRIYAEAVRRGLTRAQKIILLGDGARWIWGIADEHFPDALGIVDLYHAREHLAKVANLAYGVQAAKSQSWLSGRRQELDEGKVEAVIAAMGRLRPQDGGAQEEVHTEMENFRVNAERMRYATFRRQG